MKNWIIILFIIFLFTGCVGMRYLEEDEQLLYKIKFDDSEIASKDQLKDLLAQTPNTKLLSMPLSPSVYLYQIGRKKYDKNDYQNEKIKIQKKFDQKIESLKKDRKKEKLRAKKNKKLSKIDKTIKEGNFFMRLGEPPAVYDVNQTKKSVEAIQSFFSSKGYFRNTVDYSLQENNRKILLKFTFKEGPRYYYDSIYFNIKDTAVANIVGNALDESKLQSGGFYEEKALTDERNRLFELLTNNGYYSFNKQFIFFRVDTTSLEKQKIFLIIDILNNEGKRHKKFYIDSVNFILDAGLQNKNIRRSSEVYKKINYQFLEDNYSEKLLDWRTFLYPGDLYRRENVLETQKQLLNLDLYKFVNINFDTTEGRFIANIFTNPLDKFQTSNEIGLNVTDGLPGPFINYSFKNRNLFGGLEILEVNGNVGFEGISGVTETGRSFSRFEYGVNVGLRFPQFLFPLGRFYKAKIGKFNPQTRLSVGLNFEDRPEFLRWTFRSGINYSWQASDKIAYSLTPLETNLISSDLTGDFTELLDSLEANGSVIKNAFEPSFVSSSIFNVLFNFNNYGTSDKRSSYLNVYTEAGRYQIIANSEDQQEPAGVDHFIKNNTDFRQIIPLSSNSSIAYRVNVGIAFPFGDNNALPYEKFFFAGGSNGIRAWAPRRLGPGSFARRDTLMNGDIRILYDQEQPGEIRFQNSIEYRRKIINFINWALFLDFGNIWTIRDDPSRVGAQFRFDDFLSEMAIGTGMGLRLDFSFLLLRVDLALKMLDPAQPKGERFIGDNISFKNPLGTEDQAIINIGIGYPF